MEERISVKKLNWDIKKAKIKQKAEDVKQVATYMITEHPLETLLGVASLVKVTSEVGVKVSRERRLSKVENRKDLEIYDRSLGCYWNLRRPLTTREKMELNERKEYETLGDILSDMKVVK